MTSNSSSQLVSRAAGTATALNLNVVSSGGPTTGRPKIVPSHVARIAALPKYLVSTATSSTAAPHHSASSSSRETTAWGESSSSYSAFATPASTRPPSRIAKIHPSPSEMVTSPTLVPSSSARALPMGQACISPATSETKTSHSAKIEALHIPLVMYMMAEFTPLGLILVNKAFYTATKHATAQICYQKFLVPCLEGKEIPTKEDHSNYIPRTPEGYPDYNGIYGRLSKYIQMINTEAKQRLELIQFSEYTSLNQTVPVALGLFPSSAYFQKTLPPFNLFWNEDTAAKKAKEYTRCVSDVLPPLPPNFCGSALREMSFFLAESFSETIKLMMMPLTIEEQEALKLKVNGRIAQDTKFLSHLFRYIFDQILGSYRQKPPYRAQLYSMATSFVTHCGTYLTYEDLHYALLIHFQMVLSRLDVQDKDQILQPKLLNSMFIKIKTEKAALDKAKRQMNAQDAALDEAKHTKLTSRESQEPDLTNLKRHLQILLSQYKARMKQLQGQRNYLKLKMFTDDLSGESRYGTLLEIIKKHLPDPNSKPKSIAGCCTIL